jgi:heat shock protein HtpX
MWEQIAANRRQSALLVVVMAAVLGALGWAVGESQVQGGGAYGIGFAAIVWIILTLVAWFQGDSIYLAMSGARKITKDDLPVLHDVVEEMTIASGLPTVPDIYVIDDAAPNAFATGRKPETASVAVTSGLLKALNRDELQGVIAHELGHIRNRDILLMLFAGVMAGAIVMLAEVGLRGMWFSGGRRSRRSNDSGGGGAAIIMLVAVVLMILAPIIAQLIYFAISRKREYLADASAAAYTRYPEGLASALEKIAAAPAEQLRGANRANAPMYIVNPLRAADKQAHAATSATATHPPITERVRILRAMGGASFLDYDRSYREVTGKGGVMPRSALDDPHAGAGLRVQGSRWRHETATGAAPVDSAAALVATVTEAAAVATADDPRVRAREVDDYLYKDQGYARIECPCGTVLKVPPGLTAPSVQCPRCGRSHEVAWEGHR